MAILQEANVTHHEGEQEQVPRMVTDVKRILGELGIEFSQYKEFGRENPYDLHWQGENHRFLLRLSEDEEGEIESLTFLKVAEKDLANPLATEETKVSGIEDYHVSKTGNYLSLALTLGTEQEVVENVKINPKMGYVKTDTHSRNFLAPKKGSSEKSA